MKKILRIMILGLLWCNFGFAETIVRFPKDAEVYKTGYWNGTGEKMVIEK